MKPLFVIDDVSFDAHRAEGSHPERPERLEAARAGLERAATRDERLALPFTDVSDDDLGRVHGALHAQALERASGRRGWFDEDTYHAPQSIALARYAAGGAVALTDALIQRGGAGLALVRPPGHHATADRAMGFCLVNNVAVAAGHARARGVPRVAIVDWDVHHGNGTESIFVSDPNVLFVSLHEWPLYPGTGASASIGRGPGAGTTVNVAMPPSAGSDAYGLAFRDVVMPALEAFEPGIVLVSAGFDAHARDPLASAQLESKTFGAMTTALRRYASSYGIGLGLFLEGGYDLVAVEESVDATVRAALGADVALPDGAVSAAERDAVVRTLRAHGGDMRRSVTRSRAGAPPLARRT